MSASEKLRVLDEFFDFIEENWKIGAGQDWQEWHDAKERFRKARGHIADVVEAAERFTAAVDGSVSMGLMPSLSPATAEAVTLEERLRPALTALTEHLEGANDR